MNNPNVGNFQNNPDEFDPELLYFTFRPNDYETTTSESLNFENAIHPNVNPQKLNFENDMMNQSSVNLMNTEILNNSNFGNDLMNQSTVDSINGKILDDSNSKTNVDLMEHCNPDAINFDIDLETVLNTLYDPKENIDIDSLMSDLYSSKNS